MSVTSAKTKKEYYGDDNYYALSKNGSSISQDLDERKGDLTIKTHVCLKEKGKKREKNPPRIKSI